MIEITIPTPGIIDIKLVEKSIIATTIKIILKIDAALADLLKIFSLLITIFLTPFYYQNKIYLTLL